MDIFFYNYNPIFKNIFKANENIECIDCLDTLFSKIDETDDAIVVIPVGVSDSRETFPDFFNRIGRNDNTVWILIGTHAQIDWALINNIAFKKNYIREILLPLDGLTLEYTINAHINYFLG